MIERAIILKIQKEQPNVQLFIKLILMINRIYYPQMIAITVFSSTLLVIFTNGQVIQNETIRKLSNMNVLVRISLEGHNEEINDFIRGVGTFKKAIEFSNICRENNLSIGYSCFSSKNK